MEIETSEGSVCMKEKFFKKRQL